MTQSSDLGVSFQSGKNGPIINTPELFRLLGQLEATTKQLIGAVDMLTKSQAENNVVTNQMKATLDGITVSSSETSKTAVAALKEAERAHRRLDRFTWTAVGFGSGAGLIAGFFAKQLAAAWLTVTHMVP